jgi:hypothetical protein
VRLTTALPLSCVFFKHWHTDDTEVGVVVAKARFVRGPHGHFYVVAAPPLVLEESFAGDPAWTPLVQDQDIAPGKIGTDILIDAVARCADGAARTDWPVYVQIPDRLDYGFRVCGPATWQKGWSGWSLAPPAQVREVPLSYTLAYGGAAPGETVETPDVFDFNPAGRGYANARLLAGKEPFAAPQIGELAEFMAQDPTARMTVHGLGPIAKAWLPRRSQAGTFDKDWQQYRHPRMPHDYSLRFWNAAPLPLQVDPPLLGHEEIRLRGISATHPEVVCPLPRVQLVLQLTGEEHSHSVMTLDTVQLDLRDPAPEAHQMTLIWRARILAPHRYAEGQIWAEQLEV